MFSRSPRLNLATTLTRRGREMKTKTYQIFWMLIALVLFSAVGAQAQYQKPSQSTKQEKKGMSMDMSKMMREPHHILAMAYKENLASFTKALRDQVSGSSTVNSEFANAAVTEMRRSLTQMEQHLQEHMKTMSGDMNMSGMAQQMETHLAPIREHLGELEKDLQAATPDPKKVLVHTDEILKHLNAVSQMHNMHKKSM